MAIENLNKVYVVYATPQQQTVVTVQISSDCTVEQVLYQSKLLERYPEIDLANCAVGIFAKQVDLATRVEPGDRIEIYRSLHIEPKEARRLRAERRANKT